MGGAIISESGGGIIPLQGGGIIPESGGGFPRNQHDNPTHPVYTASGGSISLDASPPEAV
jgi:hypothetical protein